MIIDSHVHVFPEKIADKAVANIGNFYNLKMTGNGRTAHLMEAMLEACIDKAIVCSTATAKHQVRSINEFISETVKHTENFYGLITLHQDLEAEEIDHEIAFAKENSLIGIKLHPDFQQINIDDERLFKIYERAEGVLPILFHTGDPRFDYSSPLRLAKVAKLYPRLKCIAAHMGGYEKWHLIDCYKETPNVYFDTSSALFKIPPDKATEMIRDFGAERFFYGSDFPMWNMAKELERFNALDLNDSERALIMSENVKKFYGIE